MTWRCTCGWTNLASSKEAHQWCGRCGAHKPKPPPEPEPKKKPSLKDGGMSCVSITLENRPQHVDKKKILRAANFYADVLLPKLRRSIKVAIKWTYSRKVKVAEIEINDADSKRLPSDFTILMSAKRTGWQIYQSLAHEMVHIKQWAMGEMRCRKTDDDVTWLGEVYKFDQVTLAYWDSPWELEAMSLEYGLYNKFKAAFGYKGTHLAAVA